MWIELPDEGLARVVALEGCDDAPMSPACVARSASRTAPAALKGFRAARTALHAVLERCGKGSVLEHLCYASTGRPMLPEGMGFIALSHSATHAAAAYHPTRPVGIDVEGPREQLARVARKFVAPEEEGLDLRDLWGLKEALYKAVGLPGMHFARDFILEAEPTPATPGLARFPEGIAAWGRASVADQRCIWALLPVPRVALREPFRWVITGAECSGKSTWTHALSEQLGVPAVPEGVRDWMTPGADYQATDVRDWARKQAVLEQELAGDRSAVVDTDAVNFEVWLRVRFGERLSPLEGVLDASWNFLSSLPMDRWYAVLPPCDRWEPDPLREAPDFTERQRIASLHRSTVETERDGEPATWWEVAQTPLGAEIAASANQYRWPALYLCKAQGCRSESEG